MTGIPSQERPQVPPKMPPQAGPMPAHLRFRDLTLGYDPPPGGASPRRQGGRGQPSSPWSGRTARANRPCSRVSSASWRRLRAPSTVVHGFAPHDIAYLPQAAEIDRSFPIHVYDLIAMGLWLRIGAFGAIRRPERDKIHAAITATVGLYNRVRERRPIAGLSGGQLQRALFARLLLQDSPLIVLDEPFNAIDDKTVADLIVAQRPPLARRAAHGAGGASRHRPRTPALSADLAFHRARAGRVGLVGQRADAGEYPQGAPHVRGFRRNATECAVAAA